MELQLVHKGLSWAWWPTWEAVTLTGKPGVFAKELKGPGQMAGDRVNKAQALLPAQAAPAGHLPLRSG